MQVVKDDMPGSIELSETSVTVPSRSGYGAVASDEDASPAEDPFWILFAKRHMVVGGIFGAIVLGMLLALAVRSSPQPCVLPTATIYETSRNGDQPLATISTDRLSCLASEHVAKSGRRATASVVVDSGKWYQQIIGFGGAFTEAAAMNFAQLPEEIQEEILEGYFGKSGIGYTLGRIPINSCDFTVASYSFDDVAGDYDLEHFDMSVSHDQKEMLPFIKRALATSKKAGRKLNLFGSPWSPPAWLKVPVDGKQSMDGSNDPNGLKLDRKSQAAWALYFSKWIEAYEASGVPIWGLTVQNEPEFAAPWEACKMNATMQRDFIRDYLGPSVKSHHPDVKLMAFDHNKDHLEAWTQTIFADADAAKYVDGMAFHWLPRPSLLRTLMHTHTARAHTRVAR